VHGGHAERLLDGPTEPDHLEYLVSAAVGQRADRLDWVVGGGGDHVGRAELPGPG
jgi:hypothetical protein